MPPEPAKPAPSPDTHIPPGEKDVVAIYVPPGIEVQIFRSVSDMLNWSIEELGGSQSKIGTVR